MVVRSLVEHCDIKELLIEGGATAYSILNILNCKTMIPVQELSPGVIRMENSLFPAMHLTIKPGSYRWPEKFLTVTDWITTVFFNGLEMYFNFPINRYDSLPYLFSCQSPLFILDLIQIKIQNNISLKVLFWSNIISFATFLQFRLSFRFCFCLLLIPNGYREEYNFTPTNPSIHLFYIYWGINETLLGVGWGFGEVYPS